MKRYKKSLLGVSFYIAMLPLLIISEIIEHTYFKLFWIVLIIIKIIYVNKYSYYIIL